jgi:hypothetical protein
MATVCPKCKTGTLKKGEKMVYCSEYKPKKDGNEWKNEGTCDFRIMYKNKAWGSDLAPGDIKKLVDGGTLENKKGDKMTLDLDNEFFTRIEFAPKPEDEDL